jgi:hypothetical protein
MGTMLVGLSVIDALFVLDATVDITMLILVVRMDIPSAKPPSRAANGNGTPIKKAMRNGKPPEEFGTRTKTEPCRRTRRSTQMT